ncbi:MAG: NACHT domain-containing protein, partial [Saprospiraceae bacterium]
MSLQDELIFNLKAKYQKRIDSKLAGRFPVNLRINASRTGTSEETSQNFITFQDEEIGHEIGGIFDRAKGRLLVVGLPGAGKTTLLLQLAVELLGRAQRVAHLEGVPHVTLAIPVLLNLATWRSEFATFDEWLKRILPNELGASKALAEKIGANIPLILLLDGLDEVSESDRNSCLEALGQYGIKPGHQFVVSSRISEYAATKDAPVYSQVELAPLTSKQIEQNLIAFAGLTPEAKPLLNAIQNDPLLKQAIENPFYLNTAQLLFASGKNW